MTGSGDLAIKKCFDALGFDKAECIGKKINEFVINKVGH